MKKVIEFKTIHNRIGLCIDSVLIQEMTVEEFNEFSSQVDLFKSSNPGLFCDETKQITVEDIDIHKFGHDLTIGADFIDGLIGLNIRPIFFYKKDESFLIYDFIYNFSENTDNTASNYGVKNYCLNSEDAVSINLAQYDKASVRGGYVTNSYLRGILDEEVQDNLKEISNLVIMINGEPIDNKDFWNEDCVIEYETLFSQST